MKKSVKVPETIEANKPEITIVMPTKNSEMTIERVLNALLSELDERSYQYVVIDNESTDSTLNLIRQKMKNPLVLTENLGSQALAVNMGVENAQGKYVCFLDSDVIIPKGFFHNLLRHFSDPEVGAVEAHLITNKGSLISDYELSYPQPNLRGGVVAQSASRACLIVRREVLDFNIDNRLKVAEDTYLTQFIIGVKNKKIIRDYDVECLHVRGFSIWGDFKRGMRYWYHQALIYYLLPSGHKYKDLLRMEAFRAIPYVIASILLIPLPVIWVLRLRRHSRRRLRYGVMGWLFKFGNRTGLLAGFARWSTTRK